MEINITFKQLGKKQALLQDKPVALDYTEENIQLKEFLELIVKNQLNTFLSKAVTTDDRGTPHAPQDQYMQLLMDTGKAGFGNIYNDKKIALSDAQSNVLQAFEDGVFAIFQGEEQLESLEQTIHLSPNLPFTFIRLTFLAGSYW